MPPAEPHIYVVQPAGVQESLFDFYKHEKSSGFLLT